MTSKFIFPIGYYEFHKNQLFNYQLNRWHSMGYAKFEDFVEAGKKIKTFADWKKEMITFEGPGQGAARRKYGLALDLEWEKPVRAVLDYFKLNDATLLGISMGGWLCLRAAAFEPRVTRVIATGHAVDYMKSMNAVLRWVHLWFFKHWRGFMERMAEKKFQKENIATWMVKHLMYITKKEKPLDALETYLLMNERNIHSELVRQDVLIMLGRKDHLIPFKMLDRQVKALTKAKSVTTRVFTKEEQAQNHFQVGSIGLSLDVMLKWIEEIS